MTVASDTESNDRASPLKARFKRALIFGVGGPQIGYWFLVGPRLVHESPSSHHVAQPQPNIHQLVLWFATVLFIWLIATVSIYQAGFIPAATLGLLSHYYSEKFPLVVRMLISAVLGGLLSGVANHLLGMGFGFGAMMILGGVSGAICELLTTWSSR